MQVNAIFLFVYIYNLLIFYAVSLFSKDYKDMGDPAL